MLQNYIKTVYTPLVLRRQTFYNWLNKVFNQVDEDRRKEVGPDRTCAEWLLRNGAFVKWVNEYDFITDYNKLPCDETKVYIIEVDATEASVMHYGFEHFVGCKHIRKINFHKCSYLENQALKGLSPLENSLRSLRISECMNITEKGLLYLTVLRHLEELILVNLPYVKDKEKVMNQLRSDLPRCNIQFH
ncbi:hypothetical protein Zmor_021943 [Zophobas morio]|uniref:Mitochondrial ATP synthase regulatory component factor B n=2 Tax=Zophobas morio TaxID=2755281 RepID=A0AA38I719_9CUCU|nr:hypothetical protein Zmor_021943 [Zophobas morio]